MNGTEVTLTDMLRCREKRAAMQQAALERYHNTLISFCLNIPGPIKTNEDLYALYSDGVLEINSALQQADIEVLSRSETLAATGDEMLLCVDAEATFSKQLMQHIEEAHPLGRLFDIDVLDSEGHKLSRPQYRPCLICGNQAQLCARTRRHTVAEMQAKIEEMLSTWKNSNV